MNEIEAIKTTKQRNPRNNQKLKILYLLKILYEETDDDHCLTMPEIIGKLSSYDVTAERKSIYADIEQLRQFGFDIIGEQRDRNYYYKLGSRQFELPELKLLVESVQSAKFITTRKSNELIKKLEQLAGRYGGRMLQRQVTVTGRVKTMNESIYYNVDYIHTAIANNVKVRFQYFDWDVNKEMIPRHDGMYYVVSPFALCVEDGNYYLVAYDSEAEIMKHFRVDKMIKLSVTDIPREGLIKNKKFNVAEYAKKHFGMFDGEETTVTIICDNKLVGVMIDRFGKDVRMIKYDDTHVKVIVDVNVSSHFLGWIMALGDAALITGPEEVVDMMKNEIKRLCKQYGMT